MFQNTRVPAFYCDGRAHGFGMFRLDSPGDGCWSLGAPNTLPANIPSVRFKG